MNDYDLLIGVILRLPSERGVEIHNNIDEITRRIGEAVKKEYENYMIIPFGMELVEPDGKIRILSHVEYPVEREDENEEP